MYSVTSNAVYTELVDGSDWVNISTGMMYKKVGKTVFLHIDTSNGTLKFPISGVAQLNGETLYLPSEIRPSRNTNVPFIDNTNDYVVHARIRSDGMIQAWNTSTFDVTSVNSWQAEWFYRVD